MTTIIIAILLCSTVSVALVVLSYEREIRILKRRIKEAEDEKSRHQEEMREGKTILAFTRDARSDAPYWMVKKKLAPILGNKILKEAKAEWSKAQGSWGIIIHYTKLPNKESE